MNNQRVHDGDAATRKTPLAYGSAYLGVAAARRRHATARGDERCERTLDASSFAHALGDAGREALDGRAGAIGRCPSRPTRHRAVRALGGRRAISPVPTRAPVSARRGVRHRAASGAARRDGVLCRVGSRDRSRAFRPRVRAARPGTERRARDDAPSTRPALRPPRHDGPPRPPAATARTSARGTRLRVLYEPSSAECGSDEELVAVAARDARELRRARRRPSRSAERTPRRMRRTEPAAGAADADALAREAKAAAHAVAERGGEDARLRRGRPYPGTELDAAERSSPLSETPVAPIRRRRRRMRSRRSRSRRRRNVLGLRRWLPLATPRLAERREARARRSSRSPWTRQRGGGVCRGEGKEKKDGDLRAPAAATNQKKPSKNGANKAAPRTCPRRLGAEAHKTQWDSFVDWKMMEHQD